MKPFGECLNPHEGFISKVLASMYPNPQSNMCVTNSVGLPRDHHVDIHTYERLRHIVSLQQCSMPLSISTRCLWLKVEESDSIIG